MSPLGQGLLREVTTLRDDQSIASAAPMLVESGLPALPVCGEDGQLVGVFGERDVIAAVLPGYLGELSSAAFVSSVLEDVLENRLECANEKVSQHMNTEHVQVESDFSSAQLAETFLHHRVSVLPVVEDGRVVGAVTRRDYVRALSEKLPAQSGE